MKFFLDFQFIKSREFELHMTIIESILMFDVPTRYKFLTFPSREDTALELVVDVARAIIKINTQRPVKGLIFNFDNDVRLDDNCLDLIPSEERILAVDGLDKVKLISWRRELHFFIVWLVY